ncbi:MAG: cyclic pyranopterin phosphate synthase MoaA [Elusimicrobia bacterium RIFCSPLOWO2_12_FULL_59_9]|nr:MAG: cyclic pyranopterin phosphate synthase MoaA [Elusimicrobia bacterium RIFCSPLOWO2_12_FULL_59_9]
MDALGRRIDYLRVSVTDRCNLRCAYCLPELFKGFSPLKDGLSDDELLTLLGHFLAVGFCKIRLTGGEPLVRPGIVELAAKISALDGLKDLAMSTNGMLLAPAARALKDAGVRRVNISLDTLDPGRFKSVTRFGDLQTVLQGVEAALSAGLNPVKINVVVARGVNDDEIGDFVRLSRERNLHIRFIELMPMGETGFFSTARWAPLDEMKSKAGPLVPAEGSSRPVGHGPARYFRSPGGRGTVGFISALSDNFCDGCNRVRLSAKGVLVPCLDGENGVSLAGLLREGVAGEEMRRRIIECVFNKPARHHMLERAAVESANPRTMCQIGG